MIAIAVVGATTASNFVVNIVKNTKQQTEIDQIKIEITKLAYSD